MYPLDNWKNLKRGYSFGSKTFYSNFHLGLDLIVPIDTKIIAPFDGVVTYSQGKQGGLTATFHMEGYTMRFMHLHEKRMEGSVKKSMMFALSGNSGLSTSPHVHLDISKGDIVDINNHDNFVDPEKFNWKGEYMTEDEYREIASNVVNGFYLTYYHRQGSDADIQAHVNAIASFQPRKYAISDWTNRQVKEAEFKANWGGGIDQLVQMENELGIANDKIKKAQADLA